MTYRNGKSRRNSKRLLKLRDEHHLYLRIEKIRRGCELTGDRPPLDELEWHHRDPQAKKQKMAQMMMKSHQAFLAELAKCICAGRDAHRALHMELKFLGANNKSEHGKPNAAANDCDPLN